MLRAVIARQWLRVGGTRPRQALSGTEQGVNHLGRRRKLLRSTLAVASAARSSSLGFGAALLPRIASSLNLAFSSSIFEVAILPEDARLVAYIHLDAREGVQAW